MLYQKINNYEKKDLSFIFNKRYRDKDDLNKILKLINKYDVIKDCYKKAEYFINIASNALNIFDESKEKEIMKNLTYFSLERSF